MAEPRPYVSDVGNHLPSSHHETSPVGLPVRIPSRPDVPDVPGLSATGPDDLADAPDLDRIAHYLSCPYSSDISDNWRPDGFDMPAVIEAVRSVPGVREAQIRPNPNGVHTLRLDLADDADPGEVSRAVARLLKERMGLATEPHQPPKPVPVPAPSRVQPAPSQTAPYPREARRRKITWSEPSRELVESPSPDTAPGAEAKASRNGGSLPQVGVVEEGEEKEEGVLVAEPKRDMSYVDSHLASTSRIFIDQLKITDESLGASVDVRLTVGDRSVLGHASGPASDGYVLRLAAMATGCAIDQLLESEDKIHGRCFIEHATIVRLGGNRDVAVVVVILASDGFIDHLTGSALVAGDSRYAVVRATLSAVNRRIEGMV